MVWLESSKNNFPKEQSIFRFDGWVNWSQVTFSAITFFKNLVLCIVVLKHIDQKELYRCFMTYTE